MRTTFEDFIERSKAVFGERYDYSKVIYTTTEDKVVIGCPDHGDFLMRPRAHYADKRGCPECKKGKAKSGFSTESPWAKNRPKTFYIVEAIGDGERFIKFGLTTDSIVGRFQKGQLPYEHKLIFQHKLKGGLEEEKRFKKKYAPMRYIPWKKFRGDTECVEYGLKDHILKYAKELFKDY